MSSPTLSPGMLESCIHGDSTAWASMVKEISPIIRRAVAYTLKSRGKYSIADADDVCQDVLFRLFRSERRLLSTYDPDRGTFPTWLTIVARSAALDYLRKCDSVQHISVEDAELSSRDPDACDRLLSLPSGMLSPRQAVVVRLLYENGLDVAETAEVLDIHPQTVRSLRHNAFAKLKVFYKARQTA